MKNKSEIGYKYSMGVTMKSRVKKEPNPRLKAIEQRFDEIDRRFDAVDQRFDGMDLRFDGMQREMDIRFESAHREMTARFNTINWALGFGFTLLMGMMSLVLKFVLP